LFSLNTFASNYLKLKTDSNISQKSGLCPLDTTQIYDIVLSKFEPVVAMDDRVGKLKEHLEYLRTELNRLNRERSKVEREISLIENTLKNGEALYNSWTGAYPPVEEETRKKYEGMSQGEAARRFLAEHDNKPFHIREIWSAISSQGITSKAKEPIWAFSTNLSLHKDFEPIGTKKATFRLKEEAYKTELEKIKKEALEGRFPGFNHLLKTNQ
jgi:hypothetical protein